MSNPVWALLAKSLTNSETIEQAITRLIAQHESDPESHLSANGSLQSHKAAEIIDHLAASVLRDKLKFDRFQIDEHFNTIDIWNKNSYVEQTGYGGMDLRSPDSSAGAGEAYVYPNEIMENQAGLQYDPNWESRIKFNTNSDQLSYFGMYDYNEPRGPGFKVLNDSLYVVYGDHDNNEQTIEITGIEILLPHTFRIEIDYNNNTLFYVDGVLKATVATSLISNSGLIAYYLILSNTTSQKSFGVMSLHFDAEYQAD